MNKTRYNKSKTYLLPLLSELVNFDKKFFNHLRNTYIFDDGNKYKDCFFIVHDFYFKNPDFTSYEHNLTQNELFVDLIDNKDRVIYIFKFPEEYLNEYNNFKKGRYSKFGVDAKHLILEYYTDIYLGNPNAVNFLLKLKQILFKDKKLKETIEKKLKVSLDNSSELTDSIYKENETINLLEIINENKL